MATTAFQLTIRNADDTADEIVLVGGPTGAGDYPFMIAAPDGDGQSVNPATGVVDVGVMTVQVVDATGGATPYIVTSVLADADGRVQLLGRKAILKESTDAGSTWPTTRFTGYVNRLELTRPLAWSITIGETRRVEQSRQIFRQTTSRFAGVTQFLGPRIQGGWGPIEDQAPWIWEVETVQSSTYVELFLVSPFLDADQVRAINAYTETEQAFSGATLQYPGIEAVVETVAGSSVGTYTPLATARNNFLGNTNGELEILSPGSVAPRIRLAWTTSQPTVGQRYRVRAYRTTIDAQNPLHIQAHPVDIATDLLDDAGEAYDSTSASTVKTALGTGTLCIYRITEGALQQQWTQDMLYRPLGFATRTNTSGELEFYVTRITSNATPSTTIELADLTSFDPVIFDIDESTIINRVTVHTLQFRRNTGSLDADVPDGIVITKRTRTYNLDSDNDGNPDSDATGVMEQVIELPGTVVLGTAPLYVSSDYFEQQLAVDRFERWGRGGIYGDLHVARSTSVSVGEEIAVNLDHMPNGSSRGGERWVQIVQMTVRPDHRALRVLDGGVSNQPSTAPTFSMAANSTDGRSFVDVTVTNAATLNTNLTSVEVEWATASATPSAGTLLTTFFPGDVPTTAFTTPRVDSGSTVWMRMRGREGAKRPTDWTAWQSQALTALTAPSSLSSAQDSTDKTKWVISWTVGETDKLVRVLLYDAAATPSASDFRVLQYLPAGAARVRLTLPIQDQWVGLQQIDRPPHAGVSSVAQIMLSQAGATPTLADPTDPDIVVLSDDYTARPPPQRPGGGGGGRQPVELFDRIGDPGSIEADHQMTLGLSVEASEYPSNTVFELAESQATPSYAVAAVTASVLNGRTVARVTVFDSGAAILMRAKHTRADATDSGYTTAVSTDPNDQNVRVDPPSGLTVTGNAADAIQIDGNYYPRIRATWTDSTAAMIASYDMELALKTDVIGPGYLVTAEDGETGFDSWGPAVSGSVPYFFPGVKDGTDYVVRLRARDKLGRVSIYVAAEVSVAAAPTITAITDGFSTTQNASAPENGDVTLNTDGEDAYSNLEDANSTTTTYYAYFDVDGTTMASGNRVTVSLYTNDGATSTTWTLRASRAYLDSDNLTDEVLSTGPVAMGADYDLRLEITYDSAPGVNVATVTAHGEDNSVPGVQYDKYS